MKRHAPDTGPLLPGDASTILTLVAGSIGFGGAFKLVRLAAPECGTEGGVGAREGHAVAIAEVNARERRDPKRTRGALAR